MRHSDNRLVTLKVHTDGIVFTDSFRMVDSEAYPRSPLASLFKRSRLLSDKAVYQCEPKESSSSAITHCRNQKQGE